MTLRDLRVVILVALGLVLIIGLTRVGDPPELLIDPTPAASTACVKTQPVCGTDCTRLIAARNLA